MRLVATLVGALFAGDGLAAADAGAVLPLTVEDAAALAPDEGHLALVLDSLDHIQNLRFAPRGRVAAAFSLSEVPPGIHLFVFRLPAGEYCMDDFRAERRRYKRRSTDEGSFCFAVFAGDLTYPGHIVPRAGEGRNAAVRFAVKPGEFIARLALERPAVLAAHAEVRDGHATEDEARAKDALVFADWAFEVAQPAFGMRLLESAAGLGSVSALRELGHRTEQGDGTVPDLARALAYYERASAAGDAIGARNACYGYLEGWSGKRDEQQARALCERGVALGDGDAHRWLAYMHRRSQGGLIPDPTREAQLMLAGAALGSPYAQYEAALVLRDGLGVAPDLTAARGWLEKATTGKVQAAAFPLAEMLERGRGGPADASRAITLYTAAVGARQPGSAAALARLYAKGIGTARDLDKANEVLERGQRWSVADLEALAWFRATCPAPEHRDGDEALQLAELVVLNSPKRLPEHSALLAAAYAESGRFDDALRNADRALGELGRRASPDDERLQRWREQRASYAQKRAWREP